MLWSRQHKAHLCVDIVTYELPLTPAIQNHPPNKSFTEKKSQTHTQMPNWRVICLMWCYECRWHQHSKFRRFFSHFIWVTYALRSVFPSVHMNFLFLHPHTHAHTHTHFLRICYGFYNKLFFWLQTLETFKCFWTRIDNGCFPYKSFFPSPPKNGRFVRSFAIVRFKLGKENERERERGNVELR